jgi:hypothetical protein
MNIAALHNLIRKAQEHEAETGQLARFIQSKIGQLHPSIHLPEKDPEGVLLNFVSNYINQVPYLLQGSDEIAEGAGISAWIKPVLKIAENFFLQPPKVVDSHEGLEELLSEAYLAHRLVEEVNDRYMIHLGKPLIPLDLTVANLVVHQLVGEPLALKLDKLVERAVTKMLTKNTFDQESVQNYRERLYTPNVETAWRHWPCFSRQLGVELMLAEPSAPRSAADTAEAVTPVGTAPEALPSATGLLRSGGTRPSRHHKP